MAGLAIGVSSMKSGERALLHIGWELGYGNFFSKTDRRKMDGNNLFKEDKLEEAMQQYEMAIAYIYGGRFYVSAVWEVPGYGFGSQEPMPPKHGSLLDQA
ncbi:unnamed protein product [Brassica oleracea]